MEFLEGASKASAGKGEDIINLTLENSKTTLRERQVSETQALNPTPICP